MSVRLYPNGQPRCLVRHGGDSIARKAATVLEVDAEHRQVHDHFPLPRVAEQLRGWCGITFHEKGQMAKADAEYVQDFRSPMRWAASEVDRKSRKHVNPLKLRAYVEHSRKWNPFVPARKPRGYRGGERGFLTYYLSASHLCIRILQLVLMNNQFQS